jgi:hypothetical protein
VVRLQVSWNEERRMEIDGLNGDRTGSISQTLTYPFDVLRRKMQVTGMEGGPKYAGAVDALRSTVRSEGVRGLYRGLWPNLRECLWLFLGAQRLNGVQSRLRQALRRRSSRTSW